jgi:transcriptional regulator with GAF, ATPase, and Fis domain
VATLGNSKLVAIVDDDDLVRSSLQGLLKAVGMPARAFASELTDAARSAPPPNIAKFDEQDRILRILEETKGRVCGADGARMGLKRTALISRMKRLGIDPRKFP